MTIIARLDQDSQLRGRYSGIPGIAVLTNLPFAFAERDESLPKGPSGPHTTQQIGSSLAGIVCGIDWLLSWKTVAEERWVTLPTTVAAEGMIVEPSQAPITSRAGLMPVMNLSQGPTNPYQPYNPDDPVNVATKVASERMVVVAAGGNAPNLVISPGDTQETMSAWAEPPWVVAVGATSDAEGTIVAPYSPRGTAGSPNSGPDVLAFGGHPKGQEHRPGTSYAAPRVSFELTNLAAAILLLEYQLRCLAGVTAEAIPALGIGWVDRGFDGFKWHRVDADAIVGEGVRRDVLSQAMAHLRLIGLTLDLSITPDRLRTLLFESATSIDAPPHVAGHGFVGAGQALAYLTDFSAAQLARHFCTPAPREDQLDRLDQARLFDADKLRRFLSLVQQSMHYWYWDRDSPTTRCGQFP